MKPKNQVKLFENDAFLIRRSFLAGSDGKSDVFHHKRTPRNSLGFSSLIIPQHALTIGLSAVYLKLSSKEYSRRIYYEGKVAN
jgi:hypothetical protein